MQMEALECGAASLCMVLAHHGKWLPLEKVRIDCGVSRDGSNAKNIIKAARAYGLEAKGYRMELSALKEVKFPVIVHWNFNHFVVLNGFKKNMVLINDPARGSIKVSMEEFDQSFTGIVLCFSKTSNFVPEGKQKSIFSFARKRLKGTAASFAFVMITGIITAGISIMIPVFSRIFIDFILSGKNPEWLKPLIFAMIIMLVFEFIVKIIQGVYLLKIQGKLSIEANASFFWHILHLPMEFFSQRHLGDIVARQSANETIAFTLINQLAPIFMNLILVLLYLIIMLNYNVALSMVGIVAALMNLIVLRMVSKKRVNMSRVLQRDGGKLSGITMSGFEMMETIKASGAENGFFQRWAGYFSVQNNAKTQFNKSNQYFGLLPSLLQQIANIIVLMIGVYLILDGEFTIGILIAFQGFLSSFLAPVNELVGVGQTLIEMRSSMERVEDVLQYPKDMIYDDNIIIWHPIDCNSHDIQSKLIGAVDLKEITFGYSKMSEPLIKNFTLHIEKGGSVALVGGSGSGKSTLAKIIAGLTQPWSGDIYFDQNNRKQISHDVITNSISVVDQDIILFEDTIMDNITMWDRNIEKASVIAACKDAQIHEDIMRREGGYDHLIQEEGKNFSGGQRQRFEIARALAMEPSILILDEATSALDTKTEQKIMEAVKARGITLIIVAHRLSTIRDCDEIIVLDQGKVLERGSHKELINLNGKYTQLIEN